MEFIGSLHKILQRQIRKCLGENPNGIAELECLLKTISDTYTHADEDRLLTERSITLSSNELIKINKEAQEHIAEIERMNRTMIDRELKMVQLKKEIKALKEAANA